MVCGALLLQIVCWLLSPHCTMGLHLQGPAWGRTSGKSNGPCTELPEDLLWGVMVDGRDAASGRYAYGKDYLNKTTTALRGVYQMQKVARSSRLEMKVFSQIAKLLEMDFRPVDAEWRIHHLCHIEDCYKTAVNDPKFTLSVLQNITVMEGDPFKFTHARGDVPNQLQRLFNTYNIAIEKSDSLDEMLAGVASLLREMAFLHPLQDKNGRSRTLLLQFLLRQTGIACGTMNYNNNKDVYFETHDVFMAKIREGIEAYQLAESSGENPWEAQKARDHHLSFFRKPYQEDLEKCWRSWCTPAPGQAARHAGCFGTSPL